MDDYIKRADAIMIASGYCHPANTAAELASLPAADVREVVRGEWINIPGDGKFSDSCVYSVCKKSPPNPAWVVNGFSACPYCAADMRKPTKEDGE